MLQFTDPERVVNKEDSGKDGWISLGKETKIEIMGRLGTDGDENKRNQVGDDGQKEYWEKIEIGEQLSGAT